MGDIKLESVVRRQGFWDRWPLDQREDLAHLISVIVQRLCDEANAEFRLSSF